VTSIRIVNSPALDELMSTGRKAHGEQQRERNKQQKQRLAEMREQNKQYVVERLDHVNVSQRDRSIMEMRFGITTGQPMTLKEVGEKVGLTHERVRQIELQVLRSLSAVAETKSVEDIATAETLTRVRRMLVGARATLGTVKSLLKELTK
jgi:DNA-directed RNA polymerase sigma subunit (sigma70/sigma32)